VIADPSFVDPSLDSRAITFENPSGGRGAGGSSHGGRKGSPSRRLEAGEKVVLAEIDGPGTIRHVWLTVPPAPPEVMRGLFLEVSYDGSAEPSVSVPVVDFFGVPHGRPVPYASALTAIQEGRGFNTYIPMPFRRSVRVEITNGSARPLELFYQVDYTLEPPFAADRGYLHVAFRRENPTELRRDFVIEEGLRGPGRFLGCVVGVRTIDWGTWYGEGEVKVFRDGDADLATICGTGLEDYVGSAWGMGPHHAPYAGAPLEVRGGRGPQPDFVGFYRWHLLDPIMFERDLRVTIQQIGYVMFTDDYRDKLDQWEQEGRAAGRGWQRDPRPGVLAAGIAERSDDYCATSFVYCLQPQPVPRLDPAAAVADIERLPHEQPTPMELFFTTPN